MISKHSLQVAYGILCDHALDLASNDKTHMEELCAALNEFEIELRTELHSTVVYVLKMRADPVVSVLYYIDTQRRN